MHSLRGLGTVPVFKEWSLVGRDRPLVYMSGVSC